MHFLMKGEKNEINFSNVRLIFSTSTFANPFGNFLGQYESASDPEIEKINMKYCNWMGFSEIVKISIEEDNGKYSFKLYTPNGHTGQSLDEYKSSLQGGGISYAENRGNQNYAEHTKNFSLQTKEVTVIKISKDHDVLRLELSQQRIEKSVEVGKCRYSIELSEL